MHIESQCNDGHKFEQGNTKGGEFPFARVKLSLMCFIQKWGSKKQSSCLHNLTVASEVFVLTFNLRLCFSKTLCKLLLKEQSLQSLLVMVNSVEEKRVTEGGKGGR